jgi:hypothetical protein
MLAFALALAAAPAAAGPPAAASGERWVAFFEPTEGGINAWDAASLVREGELVRVWVLWDMAGVAGAPFREARLHNEIDCAARTGRVLSFATYGEGGAESSGSDEAGAHEPIRPGTAGEGLWNALCSEAARSFPEPPPPRRRR